MVEKPAVDAGDWGLGRNSDGRRVGERGRGRIGRPDADVGGAEGAANESHVRRATGTVAGAGATGGWGDVRRRARASWTGVGARVGIASRLTDPVVPVPVVVLRRWSVGVLVPSSSDSPSGAGVGTRRKLPAMRRCAAATTDDDGAGSRLARFDLRRVTPDDVEGRTEPPSVGANSGVSGVTTGTAMEAATDDGLDDAFEPVRSRWTLRSDEPALDVPPLMTVVRTGRRRAIGSSSSLVSGGESGRVGSSACSASVGSCGDIDFSGLGVGRRS